MRYFIVDAFTNRPFSGNPAAVVPLQRWLRAEWLQNVAMEMNLSETAFLVPAADGYDLRWFTPKVEVDLCGHATLAAARAISQLGKLATGESIQFSTRSGLLSARRDGDRFELDFPLEAESSAEPPVDLIESLNVTPKYVGCNRFDYLIEVESERLLRGVSPDFKRLAAVGGRGVIVTANSNDPQFDFVSRFFAPAAGIDEDPVTGSAHCCLADYWGRKLSKTKMVGYQASQRGGVVHVEVRGARVILGGETILFAEGEIKTDAAKAKNLLADLPENLAREVTEILLQAEKLRIERIVSHEQKSPDGFWYDQNENECVILLAGAARLQVENEMIELKPGSFMNIPAHCRHRVEWTDPTQQTVWLAVFYA